MARVLLAAWGTRGDTQASATLAAGLQARGHDVELAAPPFLRAEAARLGLALVPLGDDPLAWFDERPWRRSADPRVVMPALLRLFARQVAQQFEVLEGRISGADVVIGQGLSYAAPSLAEAGGVPYRYLSPNVFFFGSREQPALGVNAERLPGWLNRLTWRQFSLSYNLLFKRRINRHRRRLGVAPTSDVVQHVFDARHTIAAFDPELYPAPSDLPLPHPPVGSIPVVAQGDELDAGTSAFLEADGPVAFVDFGSMPDRRPDQTTTALSEAARRAGARLLLSAGWAGLGGGRHADGPDVHVVQGVPHSMVFPRVDVVVHHGGVGTAATAARAGVAQVVVPHAYDQHASARRLHAAGVTPAPLPKKRLDAASLAGRLERALADRQLRARAEELGRTISARDSLTAAAELVEEAAG